MDLMAVASVPHCPETGTQGIATIATPTEVPMSWATEGTTWGETAPGWRPGMTSYVSSEARPCCPKCGARGDTAIHYKGTNGSDSLGRFICHRCEHRWKLTVHPQRKEAILG